MPGDFKQMCRPEFHYIVACFAPLLCPFITFWPSKGVSCLDEGKRKPETPGSRSFVLYQRVACFAAGKRIVTNRRPLGCFAILGQRQGPR